LWNLSKIIEYLKRISLIRSGLSAILIRALTSNPAFPNDALEINLGNNIQGRIENARDTPFNRDSREKLLAKKHVEYGQRKSIFVQQPSVALDPHSVSEPAEDLSGAV
jgi:hypothetical protein